MGVPHGLTWTHKHDVGLDFPLQTREMREISQGKKYYYSEINFSLSQF